MEVSEKKPDKEVICTLRWAHQKQAQLIMLDDQKAQIYKVWFLSYSLCWEPTLFASIRMVYSMACMASV